MRRKTSVMNNRKAVSGEILLALSILAVWIYGAVSGSLMRYDCRVLPGFGITVTQYVLTAATLLLCSREKKLRWDFSSIFLLSAAGLLGLSFTVYADNMLGLLNFPLLCAFTAQAIFAVTGQNETDSLSGKGVWEGFRRFFISLFRQVPVPFRYVGRALLHEKHKGLGLGLIIAVPVVVVVLLLLSSADAVFGGFLTGFGDLFGKTDLLWEFILRIGFGLLLFSLLFSALCTPKELRQPKPVDPPPTVFAVVLAALTVIYAVFGYVQIRYFLLEGDSALIANYSEYARTGFFQMIFVAAITVAVELPALTLGKTGKAVRVLCAVVSLLTLLIDVSAFLRLRLYIQAYGLSMLRVMSLWAILMVAALLIILLIKCAKPEIRLSKVVMAALLAGWIVFNFSNPNYRIAAYNVNAYNEKALAVLDTDYLCGELTPDVRPALEQIKDEETREMALDLLDMMYETRPNWYYYSLSWRHLPKNTP